MRLQKFLAEAGVASRRAGERIILDGRVEVNGQLVKALGAKVDPVADRVTVDTQAVKSRRKLYVALNKPRGCICSRKDPANRRSLSNLLPAEWGSLYSVGRLDLDSEGLIFLTNDGQFCLRLSHPRYQVQKKYIATVRGHIGPHLLSKIAAGILDQGELLRAQKARLLEQNRSHSVLEIVLAEGKNREVRRLLESQGLRVERLQRVQIGPIKLGELPSGKWRTLTGQEIKSLLQS